MKKVQIKGKLQLNKMQVASISDLHTAQIVGGDSGGSLMYNACGAGGGPDVPYTKAAGCDMPTIGWNDGPLCISKQMDWCHGR